MRLRRWFVSLRVPTRALRDVPRPVVVLLAAALVAQLAWHGAQSTAASQARPLPPAPDEALLRVAALGEPAALARAGTLWLQYFDQQPGVSVPYRELDYGRVRDWLDRWLALEPASEYPLLLAVRLYGQVADPARQRLMLDFVHAAFRERPDARWRWLAEAALLAEHRLGDREQALRYARTLAEQTSPGVLPFWARDLRILLLEDMGEYEAARLLIGGLLESGELTDPQEIRFLERRLQALQRRPGADEPAERP